VLCEKHAALLECSERAPVLRHCYRAPPFRSRTPVTVRGNLTSLNGPWSLVSAANGTLG
jgi:hypothetical protein